MKKVLSQLNSFQLVDHDEFALNFSNLSLNPMKFVSSLREPNCTTISIDNNETNLADMLLSYSCGNSSFGESDEISQKMHDEYRNLFGVKVEQ